MADIPSNSLTGNFGTAAQRPVHPRHLFFSPLAAAEWGGYIVTVTDGKGGVEKIHCTEITADPEARGYLWTDKQRVWSGEASQIEAMEDDTRRKEVKQDLGARNALLAERTHTRAYHAGLYNPTRR